MQGVEADGIALEQPIHLEEIHFPCRLLRSRLLLLLRGCMATTHLLHQVLVTAVLTARMEQQGPKPESPASTTTAAATPATAGAGEGASFVEARFPRYSLRVDARGRRGGQCSLLLLLTVVVVVVVVVAAVVVVVARAAAHGAAG